MQDPGYSNRPMRYFTPEGLKERDEEEERIDKRRVTQHLFESYSPVVIR